MRAILRKKDQGQLTGWKADRKPRARQLRAVLAANAVRDDLAVIVGAGISDVSEGFDKLYVQFAAAEYCYLVISGQIAIESSEHSGASKATVLEPSEAQPAISALKSQVVQAAAADPNGGLTLTLDGGTVIRARGGADFEAWELRSFDGRLLVSLPGGDIAVFDPANA
jgi:hypothetical protein